MPPLADPNQTPTPPVASWRSAGWWDRPPAGRWIALALAALATLSLSIGVATPWPWSDEGATYVALRRTWPELAVLFSSPDAPWVPYYALAKLWADAVHALAPALSTLVALRLFSVLAAVGTVVVLYAIVARNAGRLTGALAGVLLLTLPGFVRHAQDARGYALLGFLATLGWLCCDRSLRPGRAPTLTGSVTVAPAGPADVRLRVLEAGGYTASLAAVGAIQTFGLLQWPAHLLATVAAPGPGRLRRRRLRTLLLIVAAAAVLVVGQVALSVLHGTGATHANSGRVIDAASVSAELLNAIASTGDPWVSLPILLLVAVGLASRVAGRRDFPLSLAIWLCVPLVLAIMVGAIRTNLFRLRYWVAFLPPLAALAALGVVAVAVGVARAVQRISGGVPDAAGGVGRARFVTVAALVALQVAVTLPSQVQVRSPSGHGENFTGVVATIAEVRAAHPGAIVAITSRSGSVMLAAIDPATLSGNPLRRLDPQATTVFTVRTPSREVRSRLAGGADVLWIYRGQRTPDEAVAAMPRVLRNLRPRVVWARPAGEGWTVALLGTWP